MSQKDEKEKKSKIKEDKKADETIMYKPIKSPKQKKPKKQKGEKKGHPKLKMFFKVLLVMFILSVVIVGGILGAIVYRCIWGDWAIDKKDLTIKYENSTMYDKDGNVVATLTGEDQNREIISKEDMSEYLPKAFISIEDERFEEHNGVDWKRTLGAFMTFATHSGESSFGGSTITQQVVKNVTGEKDDSALEGALRKIKEIVRAYEVENMLSKDQILELYLNLIPLGGGAYNIYGVQMASKYYFNKDAKDVTVAEAAYIAGITSAPNRYNPFGDIDRTETINSKVKTVLKKMYELGKINEEEYNSGLQEVENGLAFSKGEVSQNNKLSYYLEAARDQILKDLMEENNWSKDEAQLHLYGDGYQIYTAYDQKIQADVDAQFVDNASKWSRTIKVTRTDENGEKYTEEVQRQGSMVIIDNSTGYVVAGAGGIGEKTEANGTNRMELKGHSPGSCMKPIGVIAPSLEEKLITAGTTVDDIPTTFGSYKPNNWYSGYRGFMNIREMLASSTNIPEVILLQQLTVPKALSYLDKMGVDVSAEDDVGLSLALGGMTNGITAVELAAAYETIANGGVYKQPKYYSKITNAEGETILEAKQEETRVFSEQNAWIMQELLSVPIYNGETGGGNARITGQEVRGKTGTTNSNSSAWFCGFTGHYTASVWMGFDRESDGNNNTNANSTQCAILWQAVMSKAHSGLEKKSWDKPGGITTAAICKTSGLLATEECRHDPEGNKAYTEYFVTGTVPKDYCTTHVTAKICKKTNLLASENCQEVEERVFITRKNAEESRWKSAADAKYMVPTKTCEECKAKPVDPVPDTNTVNQNTTTNTVTVKPGGNTNTNNNTAKPGGNTQNTNTNTNTNTSGNTGTKPTTPSGTSNPTGTGTGSTTTTTQTKPNGTGSKKP